MDAPTPPVAANPYVGPRSFLNGETLYARDREARQLLDVFIAERIVLLHSPSGAGKTSLIQASLLQRLRKQRFQVLPIIRLNVELTPEQEKFVPPEGRSFNRYLLSAMLCLEEDETIPVADKLAIN